LHGSCIRAAKKSGPGARDCKKRSDPEPAIEKKDRVSWRALAKKIDPVAGNFLKTGPELPQPGFFWPGPPNR